MSDDEDTTTKILMRASETLQIRPVYGAQVTITSESDKKLAKLAKKEQKKKKKLAAGLSLVVIAVVSHNSSSRLFPYSTEEVNALSNATLLGFDGEYLREAREAQLRLAASAPQVLDTVWCLFDEQQKCLQYPHCQ